MNNYYTYILKCSDDSYYVGVTNNIERRIREHQEGKDTTSYTFTRRPLELVYYDTYFDINQAIAREKQLKKWSRKKKQALIEENSSSLIQLSKKNFK